MAGDGGTLLSRSIHEDGMVGTFSQAHAPMLFKVPHQIASRTDLERFANHIVASGFSDQLPVGMQHEFDSLVQVRARFG